MMDKTGNQIIEKPIGSVRSYLFGFVFSILLTLLAYTLTVRHFDSGHTFLDHNFMIFIVLFLAVLQLIVQLIFFLHMAHEKGPRWNLVFFVSTISIILVVVVGSLWIMDNLNTNMTPYEMSQYLLDKEGYYK